MYACMDKSMDGWRMINDLRDGEKEDDGLREYDGRRNGGF